MGFFGEFAQGLAGSSGGRSGGGLLSSFIPQGGLIGQFFQRPQMDLPPQSFIPSVKTLLDKDKTSSFIPSVEPANDSMESSIAPIAHEFSDSIEAKYPKAYKVAQAIAQIESSGNYSAVGPTVKGSNAYGKYQIMKQNIPSWSKEATGRTVSLSEFRSNHQLQDRIAVYKMNALLEQGYSPQDVAAIWLSGRPLSGNQRKDLATGVSVPKYVQNFNKYYNA